MNKKTFLFSLSATALLLQGCTEIDQIDFGGEAPISLTAAMAVEDDGMTRAGTAIQSTQFAQGETFYAYFPSNVTVGSTTSASNTTFTTSNTAGATSPATTPYMNAGQSSATVHAYYPSTVTNTTSSFSVQTAQNTDANYKSSDLMYATGTVTKSGSSATGSLTFTHKMAKILVTANIGAGVTNIQSIKIVGGYRTIDISTPLSCTLGTSLSNPNSTSSYITMYSGTSTSTVNCAALIPPQSISGNFLQIVTDKGTATYSLASSKSFASGQSYTFNITVNAAAIGTTIAITNWANNGRVTVNPTVVIGVVPKVVDLGLSVKWANMNVGATSETDYGMYFMWGDVAGHPGCTYDGNYNTTDGFSFDWDNYKWGTSTSNLTKYNSSDGKTTLEAADDAATANWGSGWRMPTQAEFNELLNNTTKAWTSDYNDTGVAGYTFTANGQTLFLPAPGFRFDTYINYPGEKGYYWSSTLYSQKFRAYLLIVSSSNGQVSYNNRTCGCPVRPVQSN